MLRDYHSPSPSGGALAYGDLTDRRYVERTILHYEPEVLIHVAAVAIVSQTQSNPHEVYASNVTGTLNLLEACKKLKTKPFVMLLGTDKVLGNATDSKEDAPYPPVDTLGPYEQSKMMAEMLCQRYARSGVIDLCLVRSCNIYGPGTKILASSPT